MDVFPFDLLNLEHERILQEAARSGVTLRLLGALAFELRCLPHAGLRSALGRHLSDLDYLALSKQWDEVVKLLSGLGFSFDERHAMLHGHERVIFFHPDGLRVDVFFDKLDMCHAIDLRERLEIHPMTLSLADLLLEKLQIVRLTEKDITDSLVLFLEYPIVEDETGINAAYIAERLAWDWGFYYTASTNLGRLRNDFLPHLSHLSEEDRIAIGERIDALLSAIHAAPKTAKWKLRAKVGPALKWYKDVGELVR
jgi:hypothetical protein